MKFYHFTGVEYLPGIALQGLRLGEVPLSPTEVENAVWLTTDIDPRGHGLSKAGEATGAEYATAVKLGMVKPGERIGFADKRAVRLEVEIAEDDIALAYWPDWSVKRGIPRVWRKMLDRTGGGKSKTWWLYQGVIPPLRLTVFDARTGEPMPGWPEKFVAEAEALLAKQAEQKR